MTSEPIAPTAERVLRLIELLLNQTDGLTAQDLLIDLDISRSTLFLLLRTLKELGYIEQAEKRGKYRIGARLQAWQTSPTPSSQDLLTAFYQETARYNNPETLFLALESKDGPFIIAQAEGENQIRCVLNAGQIYPHLNSVSQLFEQLPSQQVQSDGYSLTAGKEIIQLALPICRDGMRPEAVLLLLAPAYRWQPESLLETYLADLRAMAARLSYRLGSAIYNPYHSTADKQTKPVTILTSEEISSFLQGPWAARLACVRPDGKPHVIPVWQEWDGKLFYVVAWHGSQWAEYLLQNPNVSLTIDEHWSPLRRVVASGTAVKLYKEDEPFALEQLIQRMTYRYLGHTSKGLLEQVDSAFSIVPDKLRGWQGIPVTIPR